MPSRSSNVASNSSTSASRAGDSLPAVDGPIPPRRSDKTGDSAPSAAAPAETVDRYSRACSVHDPKVCARCTHAPRWQYFPGEGLATVPYRFAPALDLPRCTSLSRQCQFPRLHRGQTVRWIRKSACVFRESLSTKDVAHRRLDEIPQRRLRRKKSRVPRTALIMRSISAGPILVLQEFEILDLSFKFPVLSSERIP